MTDQPSGPASDPAASTVNPCQLVTGTQLAAATASIDQALEPLRAGLTTGGAWEQVVGQLAVTTSRVATIQTGIGARADELAGIFSRFQEATDWVPLYVGLSAESIERISKAGSALRIAEMYDTLVVQGRIAAPVDPEIAAEAEAVRTRVVEVLAAILVGAGSTTAWMLANPEQREFMGYLIGVLALAIVVLQLADTGST